MRIFDESYRKTRKEKQNENIWEYKNVWIYKDQNSILNGIYVLASTADFSFFSLPPLYWQIPIWKVKNQSSICLVTQIPNSSIKPSLSLSLFLPFSFAFLFTYEFQSSSTMKQQVPVYKYPSLDRDEKFTFLWMHEHNNHWSHHKAQWHISP